MIPFCIGLLTCLGAFFRSRYILGLEIPALQQQLGGKISPAALDKAYSQHSM
jgi:hypothetical protein